MFRHGLSIGGLEGVDGLVGEVDRGDALVLARQRDREDAVLERDRSGCRNEAGAGVEVDAAHEGAQRVVVLERLRGERTRVDHRHVVGKHPFDGKGNVPAPLAHVAGAGEELEPDGLGAPDGPHAGEGGVGRRADPAREVPGRTDAIAPEANTRQGALAQGVLHHLPVVGHEDERGFPEGVEIGVRIACANLQGIGPRGDVGPLGLRIEDAPLGVPAEFLRDVGGKAAAVPFAPISVAAEVEPSQQRVPVVSSAERLDEPFVGFEEDGVVEVRGVLRLCGERGGPGLPPGADADLKGILAGALVEDPFRSVVLGPAAAIHAHDAEGDRKPMPLAAGQ